MGIRSGRVGGAVCALVVCLCGVPGPQVAASSGSQPRRTLGCDAEQAGPSIVIPAGAGNARTVGSWKAAHQYLMMLEATASVDPGSKPGMMEVTAELGGAVGAEIELKVLPDGRVRWSTNDLTRGVRTGSLAGGSRLIRLTNYMPFGSVRPGPEQTRFATQCYGPISARVAIGPRSGLRPTARQPAHLHLSVSADGEAPAPHRLERIGFELENLGDMPVRSVDVRLQPIEGRVRLVGRRLFHLTDFMGVTRGTFTVVPRSSGPMAFEIAASSGNSNSPMQVWSGEAMVRPPGEGDGGAAALVSIILAVGAVGAGSLFFARRRAKHRRE